MLSVNAIDLEAQLLKEGEQDLTGLKVTRDIKYIESVSYPDDKDRLDVFMPEGASNVPVVLFFHGGALRGGNKVDGEALAARVVSHGIGVVSANYRLTPAVQHPGHASDAAAAFAWVSQNIREFGGDPDHLFVSGHSAGAYLAVLLALDPVHLANHGLSPDLIKGVIPISPFLYVEETAKVRPKDVWGNDPADWFKASVTPHITVGKPPMLMIYADGDEDWRREQNERFADEMRKAGNKNIAVSEISNRDHFTIITKMNDSDDTIRQAILKFILSF